MSRPLRLSAGFTLMEVILVLIVGATLLAGGTLMYNQLRESAGSANANARSMQLQGVVEKLLSSTNGQLPKADALRLAWLQSRKDAESSPWGGKVQCQNGCGADAELRKAGIREIPVCINDSVERCFESDVRAGDVGVLVYLRYDDRMAARHISFLDVWDHSQKLYVHNSRYAVAFGNPDGRYYYFVHGPSDSDEAGKPRPPDTSKGRNPLGNCSCFGDRIPFGDQFGR